jgi:Required for nuclear transport of RNA pol II C-terminus 1
MEVLAINGSSSVRPLAREARLVMTARLAHTPELNKLSSREEQTQETYQKALKLLQDPILPVRAHGLLLLRHLVSLSTSDGTKSPRPINQSLVPAILSIFLQSVQDDDSYIFLNAVQGLAAMVDTFGKDVLQSLMYNYAGGLDGLGAGNLSQQDVDIRTRVGEALNIVINRCGSALGIYGMWFCPGEQSNKS